MRAAKVDGNHAQIVRSLRQAGASVQSMARLGQGAPDLLVGFQGQNWVMEVKAEKGLVRAFQAAWMSNWRGHVVVVRSVDEALAAIGVGRVSGAPEPRG